MQPSAGPVTGVEQFIRDWSDGVLSTGPLTEAERSAAIDAVRRCYRHAGLSWPGRVVWAPSPVAGQRTANELARRHAGRAARAAAVTRWVRQSVRPSAAGLLAFGLAGFLLVAEVAVMLLVLLPGDPVIKYDGDTWLQGGGAWIGGVVGGLAVVAPLAQFTWQWARDRQSSRHVSHPGLRAVVIALGMVATGIPALGALCGAEAGRWVNGLVGGAGPPTWDWIRTLLAVTLIPAVLAIAVLGGVPHYPELRFPRDPAYERLRSRLDGALAASGDAAAGGPGTPAAAFAALDEVAGVVGRHFAPWLSLYQGDGRRELRRYVVGCFDDRGSSRLALASWQVTSGAPVPADEAAAVADFAAAASAGWWWPHTEFVVIGERPSRLRVDSGRLHSTDGPAAEWADGYQVYAVRGVQVPADLVEHGWDVEQIHEYHNSEVRRVAIELMGWDVYIKRAGWRRVATAPDPGNPPHKLVLYADPERRVSGVRVLVMTNGSPDRTGKRRRYAETVPAGIDDPVEAAAWQYGCSARVYRQLQRRT